MPVDLEPRPEPFDRAHATAVRAGDGLQALLRGLAAWVGTAVTASAVVGVATFATGWWVFDTNRSVWAVVGAVLCGAPVAAGAAAWWRVVATARRAPTLVDEIQRYAELDGGLTTTLIDHDTGDHVRFATTDLGSLPGRIAERRREFPALHTAMRALTTAPGLALRAVVGTCLVGLLGTVLLIGGLID